MSAVSYFEEVTGFKFWDASSWSLAQAVVFVTGVACAFEFLGRIVPLIFETRRKIEMRGKHHDALDVKDLVRDDQSFFDARRHTTPSRNEIAS